MAAPHVLYHKKNSRKVRCWIKQESKTTFEVLRIEGWKEKGMGPYPRHETYLKSNWRRK